MKDRRQINDFEVDLTANNAFKPGVVLGLLREDMEPLIDAGKEVSGEGDFAILTVLPGFKIAVATSRGARDIVLKDTERFDKPDAAKVMEILSAPGILSESAGEGESHTRKVARGAINEYFNSQLGTDEFAIELRGRVDNLVESLAANPEIPYDELMKSLRLDYLRELYFSDRLTQAEMAAVYEYTETVFGILLSMSVRTPVKNILRKTWHDMTPKNLKPLQSEVEVILHREIDARIEQEDLGEDLFGNMIAGMMAHHPDGPNRQMSNEVISGFLQILFASTDTTSSLVGSILKKLALNPELQDELRTRAANFVAQLPIQDGVIRFSDIKGKDNPDLLELMKFVGHCLAESPPTPTTARKAAEDIFLQNGVVIPKGTNVFAVLSLDEMREMSQTDPEELYTYAKLMGFSTFGGGPTVCVGRPFALYEAVATLIIMLLNSSRIYLNEEGQWITSSTGYNKGMRVGVEMSEG